MERAVNKAEVVGKLHGLLERMHPTPPGRPDEALVDAEMPAPAATRPLATIIIDDVHEAKRAKATAADA